MGQLADDVRERVGALARHRSARLVLEAEATEMFELRVPGSHNQTNARFAALVAEQLGVSMASAGRALTEFAGLPHRLQFVSVIEGVRYFNDSKSTSAEAVGTALRSFSEPVVLLCGGKDTGRELDRIADGPWETVRAVVCFGDAAERLMQMLTSLPADRRPSVVHTEKTVDRAVSKARSIAQPGDVVLLSPGCPSYDAFCNYEERGDAFVAKVKSLASLDPAPI
ncbi:MAG: hypothetical protein GXP29_10905 [Planctomycetes bacterium]|nr:hypothetical protein [Planctomycetota bacterium]